MTTFRYRASFILATLALSSCSPEMLGAQQADTTICAARAELVAPEKSAENPFEQVEVAERCVRRWAYKLGISQGSNAEIAKVAVSKCHTEIYLIPGAGSKELTFPKPEDVANEEAAFAEESLKFVIEGRAGNCSLIAKGLK